MTGAEGNEERAKILGYRALAKDTNYDGSRDGGRAFARRARIVFSENSSIDRPCARRLSHTVSIRSAKRDPHRLAEPKDVFQCMGLGGLAK